MSKEIERKYFIKEIPENLEILQIIDIEQMHIYKDVKSSIRIRKIDNIYPKKNVEYIYTLKVKNGSEENYMLVNKDEYEYNIAEKEFKVLKKNKIKNIINKQRIFAKIDNELVAEIDVYKDYLDGFLTLEVEFPDEEFANNYVVPDWFGKEIGYKDFSNRKLANMNEEEFHKKVSNRLLDKNRLLINKLIDLEKKLK